MNSKDGEFCTDGLVDINNTEDKNKSRKYWLLTYYNNKLHKKSNINNIVENLNAFPHLINYVFQIEKDDQEREHIHIAIELDDKKSKPVRKFIKIFPEYIIQYIDHIEAAREYCSKKYSRLDGTEPIFYSLDKKEVKKLISLSKEDRLIKLICDTKERKIAKLIKKKRNPLENNFDEVKDIEIVIEKSNKYNSEEDIEAPKAKDRREDEEMNLLIANLDKRAEKIAIRKDGIGDIQIKKWLVKQEIDIKLLINKAEEKRVRLLKDKEDRKLIRKVGKIVYEAAKEKQSYIELVKKNNKDMEEKEINKKIRNFKDKEVLSDTDTKESKKKIREEDTKKSRKNKGNKKSKKLLSGTKESKKKIRDEEYIGDIKDMELSASSDEDIKKKKNKVKGKSKRDSNKTGLSSVTNLVKRLQVERKKMIDDEKFNYKEITIKITNGEILTYDERCWMNNIKAKDMQIKRHIVSANYYFHEEVIEKVNCEKLDKIEQSSLISPPSTPTSTNKKENSIISLSSLGVSGYLGKIRENSQLKYSQCDFDIMYKKKLEEQTIIHDRKLREEAANYEKIIYKLKKKALIKEEVAIIDESISKSDESFALEKDY